MHGHLSTDLTVVENPAALSSTRVWPGSVFALCYCFYPCPSMNLVELEARVRLSSRLLVGSERCTYVRAVALERQMSR